MRQFDWITWAVEAAGFLILCLWIIVPIREFRAIFNRVRQRPRNAARANAKFDRFVSGAGDVAGSQPPEPVSAQPLSAEPVSVEP